MMPTSVLRIWGLGILSWALLGLGIYLAVQAYDQFNEPAVALDSQSTASDLRVADDSFDTDASGANATDLGVDAVDRQTDIATGNRSAAATDDWRPWAYLTGAIACLAVSLFGYWPISLFLGNSSGEPRSDIQPTDSLVVGRPDGSQLHVEIYGDDKSRPTLLLTHGWSLDRSAWDYVKGHIIPRYRVVAWDLAGLGKSQGPANADHSLEKMAQDLEAVLRATSAQGPVILAGHSIGGMILQTFCRLFPHHLGRAVDGIALVHTTYTNPLRTIIASSFFSAIEKPVIVPMNYLTIALSPLAWLSNWQSYLNGSLHIWTRVFSFAGNQTREQVDHGSRLAALAWPGTVARGNLAMLKFDEQPTLPQVQIPVLVIGGEHDRITRLEASEHIEGLLPNDRPFVVKGGHLGYWELGSRVAEILGEFTDHVASAHSKKTTSATLTGESLGSANTSDTAARSIDMQ